MSHKSSSMVVGSSFLAQGVLRIDTLAASARVVVNVDIGIYKPHDPLLIELVELVDTRPGREGDLVTHRWIRG